MLFSYHFPIFSFIETRRIKLSRFQLGVFNRVNLVLMLGTHMYIHCGDSRNIVPVSCAKLIYLLNKYRGGHVFESHWYMKCVG